MVKRKVKIKTTDYKCPVCDYLMVHETGDVVRDSHKNSKKNRVKVYQCKYCNICVISSPKFGNMTKVHGTNGITYLNCTHIKREKKKEPKQNKAAQNREEIKEKSPMNSKPKKSKERKFDLQGIVPSPSTSLDKWDYSAQLPLNIAPETFLTRTTTRKCIYNQHTLQ